MVTSEQHQQSDSRASPPPPQTLLCIPHLCPCHSEPRVGGPHRSSCIHGTSYLHHTLFTVTDEQPQPLQSDQQPPLVSSTHVPQEHTSQHPSTTAL
jgi:hypothetical protein